MTPYQHGSMPLALAAIPIQKDLKRYYWSKFCWLKYHNGPKHACSVFKTLRQVLMAYIDTPNRLGHLDTFLQQCPVRKNGWLRKLFLYADTQPHAVLQFLKLYTCVDEPVVTVEEAAEEMQSLLEAAQDTGLPHELRSWLWALSHKKEYKQLVHSAFYELDAPEDYVQRSLYEQLARTCQATRDTGGSVKDVLHKQMSYWDKMRRILTPNQCTDEVSIERIRRQLPTLYSYLPWKKMQRKLPQDYTDIGTLADGGITPFDEDLMALMSFVQDPEYEDCIAPIFDALPDEMLDLAGQVNPGDEDTAFVGHIRQIPKKGTVVRRSIADPNKFLQAGLEPYRKFLRSMTNKIPRNCQFDQSKLDDAIVKELNHGYAGSVDLSQATDWLPLKWFAALEKFLIEVWYPSNTLNGTTHYDYRNLVRSRNLFYRMSRGVWDNDGYAARWLRGQPLGTSPSFEILTITHFCVLEALCWYCDELDSPYALLGDDVVIFRPAVRERYIALMMRAGSPLSLHKSYSGRITEFAGKVHVVNQKVRYCSDIPMISWTNLFDWQRSTGVSISYGDLPKEVKARLIRHASDYQSGLRPEDLYKAMQWCALLGTGFQADAQILSNDMISMLVSNFLYAEGSFEEEELTGTYGFVTPTAGVGTYDHQVVLPTKLRKQSWWIKKVRPESTTSICNKCLGRVKAV